ncbi:hypothetical protein KEM52_000349, partial [Ascosphaera acerosa]
AYDRLGGHQIDAEKDLRTAPYGSCSEALDIKPHKQYRMAESSELESFRRRWREEVHARQGQQPQQQQQQQQQQRGARCSEVVGGQDAGPPEAATVATAVALPAADANDSLENGVRALRLDDGPSKAQATTPVTALDHFEAAVAKEAQGSLGTSLDLYRKAYRLDSDVDKAYRQKHFPRNGHDARTLQRPNEGGDTSSQTPASSRTADKAPVLSTAALVASFAHVPISPAESPIEGAPPLACPIAHMPTEILAQILCLVAEEDPAMLKRVALVCKRMSWHVSNEQSVYKALCLSRRFGLGSMQYRWRTTINGSPLYQIAQPLAQTPPTSHAKQRLQHAIPPPHQSWREAYQLLPRIRFTGIYISTINYNRPGAHADLTNVSAGAPIHVVTYYRYLRFYPDGTAIHLVTTAEPVEIVRHVTRENLDSLEAQARVQHRLTARRLQPQAPPTDDHSSASVSLPTSVQDTLRLALRGRWRLDTPVAGLAPDSNPEHATLPFDDHAPPTSEHEEQVKAGCPAPDPRDVTIETEGVHPKYTFRMHLSLRSAHSRSTNVAKNTGLIWRSFWSYDSITDDWVEFGLRHDRPFIFSRVKGWGMD